MKELMVEAVKTMHRAHTIKYEWKIYSDSTVDIKISSFDLDENQIESKMITDKKLSILTYKSILRKLKTKDIDKAVGERVFDGNSWDIVMYENGEEVLRRKGQIYGIKPFEQLAKKLETIIEK